MSGEGKGGFARVEGMNPQNSPPLIERLYSVQSSVRLLLRESSDLSAKLAGESDQQNGATPERAQDSVTSLVEDIEGGLHCLEKIIGEQNGMVGMFTPTKAGEAGNRLRA